MWSDENRVQVVKVLSDYGVITSVRRKIGSRDRNLCVDRSSAIEFCARQRIEKCFNFVASHHARTLDRLIRSLAWWRKGELDLTGGLIGSFTCLHDDEKGNLISSTPKQQLAYRDYFENQCDRQERFDVREDPLQSLTRARELKLTLAVWDWIKSSKNQFESRRNCTLLCKPWCFLDYYCVIRTG